MASVAISDTDAAASRNGNVESPHVLVVDDDPINRKLVEIMLEKSSCKVTTAANGWKALEYLGLINDHKKSSKNGIALQVNMIITDYEMPGMTGYNLLKKVKNESSSSKKKSSTTKNVPVVIMSSDNIPARVIKCLDDGALMFISKPVKKSNIEKLISQMTQMQIQLSKHPKFVML